MEKQPKQLVAVKWDRPGSRFHGVVHSVPHDLVDHTGEEGRVVVWWPRRAGGKKWAGHLTDGKYMYILQYVCPIRSGLSCCVLVKFCCNKSTTATLQGKSKIITTMEGLHVLCLCAALTC